MLFQWNFKEVTLSNEKFIYIPTILWNNRESFLIITTNIRDNLPLYQEVSFHWRTKMGLGLSEWVFFSFYRASINTGNNQEDDVR